MVRQNSQGPLSHYRLNEIDPNPLDRKRRKVADADAPAAPHFASSGGSVMVEDQENRKALERTVRSQFGTNPLPALDAVRIDVRRPPTRA